MTTPDDTQGSPDTPEPQPAAAPAPLTPRQQKALAALMSTGDVKAAAKKARVGYSTVRRWLKNDEGFREAFASMRSAALAGALGLMEGGAVLAVKALRDALKDESVDVRIKAADRFLSHLPKVSELAEVKEEIADALRRIEEIEEADQARGSRR